MTTSTSTNEFCQKVELELGTNDAEALLRHAQTYQPNTGDPWEDARLRDALEALGEALVKQVPWAKA